MLGKNRSFLLTILFGISIAHYAVSGNVQSSTELTEQLKTFKGRVRSYSQCLQGKYSWQDGKTIAVEALKDGVLLVGTVGSLWWLKNAYGSMTFINKLAHEIDQKFRIKEPFNLHIDNTTIVGIKKPSTNGYKIKLEDQDITTNKDLKNFPQFKQLINKLQKNNEIQEITFKIQGPHKDTIFCGETFPSVTYVEYQWTRGMDGVWHQKKVDVI